MTIIFTRNEDTHATLYRLEGASRLEIAKFKAENCHIWARVCEVVENTLAVIIDYDVQPTIIEGTPTISRYRQNTPDYYEYLARERRFEDRAFYDRERGLY